MLHIRLGKQLDQFTLRVDVSLGARVTGLFGPSGSGKTTLLNCLAGLIRPDDGQFRVDETCFFDSEQSTHIPCRHREIGYVFQDGLLFDHMTVRQNLNFSRHTRSGPNLEQVVDVLELDHLIDRGASNLSGGEARRVALGRAILSAPRLLLLDEPLTGLDRRMSGKTLAYIRNVLDAFEIPTCMSRIRSAISSTCAMRLWCWIGAVSSGKARPANCWGPWWRPTTDISPR